MSAALLSIGTELTRGELINTNASWLSEQLILLGFDVVEHRTVADNPEQIATALQQLASVAGIVVCTGGLGPTTDDLTAASAAKAAGVALHRDPATLEVLRRRYESRGRPFTDARAKQADVPVGANILVNAIGTAPGFELSIGNARCFFTPGVPREMTHIFQERIVPTIAADGVRDCYQSHLRTYGLAEAAIQERLRDLEAVFPGVAVGYRVQTPEVEVKLLAKGASMLEAETLAKAAATEARQRLGKAVYGERDDSFASAVGDVLRARGLTLSAAESCTGGMVGSMLTGVPGSSDYLLFDAVTYANSAKTEVLGVSTEVLRAYGAVSEESARAMAEGALRVGGSDLAVSITGIAGPGGGTEQKPVGTVWFGLARKAGKTETLRHQFDGDRDLVRRRAAYRALDLVRRAAEGRDLTEEV